MVDITYSVLILLLLGLALNFVYWSRNLNVGTVHSSRKMRKAFIDEISDIVDDNEAVKIVDPGCGTGELARQIAKEIPDSKVIGIELSPLPYGIARLKKKLFGPRKVKFIREDFLEYDYSDADIVVMFLPQPVLKELEPKLQEDLKPGSFVISNAFKFPENWILYRKKLVEKILNRHLYCYRVS